MPRLACALLLWTACAAAQTVEGVVVDSSTGNGIGGAKVELVPLRISSNVTDPQVAARNRILAAFEGTPAHTATTDPQGRFQFVDVAPGEYAARYAAIPYADEAFNPLSVRRPSREFQVVPGAGRIQLEARMVHLARLSGRVVDGRGDPVTNVRIDLVTGALIESADIEAGGKFQFFLFPGSPYTLTVAPPYDWKPPDPEEGTGRAMAWVRTYYPGTRFEDAAQRIVLPPGGELNDVEIKLAVAPAHAVRGKLLNPDGTPAAKIAISVGEDRVTDVFRTQTHEDGAFEFKSVAEGNWRLLAEADRGGACLRMLHHIEVVGKDVENLELRLAAPFAMAGQVVAEAPQGQTAPKAGMVRLYPISPGPGVISEPPLVGRPDAKGGFVFDRAYTGRYRLSQPSPLDPPFYLAALRLGEVEVPPQAIDIAAGGAVLTLIFRQDGGTVRGTADGCGTGRVWMVPQEPSMRWPGSIRDTGCDTSGRFEIAGVRPGAYYIVAFAGGKTMTLGIPEWDDSLLNQAGHVEVRAKETTSVDLKALYYRPN